MVVHHADVRTTGRASASVHQGVKVQTLMMLNKHLIKLR